MAAGRINAGFPVWPGIRLVCKQPDGVLLAFIYSAINLFLAVSQFKLNVPGAEKHIIPDLVLFANG